MLMNSWSEKNGVVKGFKGYTQMELGNVNILISVPHDGFLKPESVQDRSNKSIREKGLFILNDTNTRPFSKIIKRELSTLFSSNKNVKVKPFVIFNNLHRIKMDPNRRAEESYFPNDEEAAIAFNDYHKLIETYFLDLFMLNSPFRQGLIIDMHGQTHKENWIELGYLLTPSDLSKELSTFCKKKSSIRLLSEESKESLEDLVRGKLSLGSLIEKKDFCVVPSPSIPSPNGKAFYSGGYITQRYASKDFIKYRVNGIQIELPRPMRELCVLESCAKQIATCIYEYYHLNSFEKQFNGR